MVHIYLRHANDGHKTIYKQDAKLTKKGKRDTAKAAHRLVKHHGFPDEIRFSPFLRTAETAHLLYYKLLELNNGRCKTRLIPDVDLSRYFNRKERRYPSVSAYTQQFAVPLDNQKAFHRRLKRHRRKMKGRGDETIWFITHALAMKYLAEKRHISLPEDIKFLHYFIYR
jgi:broad specificity phosphatase PhoE